MIAAMFLGQFLAGGFELVALAIHPKPAKLGLTCSLAI
jgi:hypothetical protein